MIEIKTLEYFLRSFFSRGGDNAEIIITSNREVKMILRYKNYLSAIKFYFNNKKITRIYFFKVNINDIKISHPMFKEYPLNEYKDVRNIEEMKIKTIFHDYLKI